MKKLTLISFGFKYGIPNANYYFDVSFAKNPARDPRWTLFDKPDSAMVEYVLNQDSVGAFIQALIPMIETILTLDDDARIALGCNAGRHRSTIMVDYVAKMMKAKGITVEVVHREYKTS